MTDRKRRRGVSRRTMLRGMGAAALASPFLPWLRAHGEDATETGRLILFFTPHGTIHDNWRPTGTERDFTLGPILAPLAGFEDRLMILDGMNVDASISVGAPHTKGPALLWTAAPLIEDNRFERNQNGDITYFGWNSGPSVDQVLAPTLSEELRYGSLELGVRMGAYASPGQRMIYKAAEQPLPVTYQPAHFLDYLAPPFVRGRGLRWL